ncbi:hypothetical protein HWV62_26783 [Athelia sp. TMB]|nr:hypothetical protein HWV62_26783 [Athelia sp. TMB]
MLAFSINKFLDKIFADSIKFCSLQARTGSVIAGSTALAFFTCTWFPRDNMNVYVNPGHEYEVARDLIDVQGFAYRPIGSTGIVDFIDGNTADASRTVEENQGRGAIYAVRTIERIYRFVKSDEEGFEIELLMMLTARSVLHAILNTHSMATFEVGGNQVLKWNNSGMLLEARMSVNNYQLRGHSKRTWTSKSEAKTIFKTGVNRHVGDRHCWSIKLNTNGVNARALPTPTSPEIRQNLIFENSWKLVGAGSHFQMRFCVVSLPVFRYSYTVGDDSEAAAMREFYNEQWDGMVDSIQSGNADIRCYSEPEQLEVSDKMISMVEIPGWLREETESTISGRSYFETLPVLINAKIKTKMTKEILHHYRSALDDISSSGSDAEELTG